MTINKREKTLEVLEKFVFPLEEKCLQKVNTCQNYSSNSSAIKLHKKNDNSRVFPAGRFLLEISKTLVLNEFQEKAIDYLDNIDYVDWIFSILGKLGEKHFELRVRLLEEVYIISSPNIKCSYQYDEVPKEEDMLSFFFDFERIIL